MRTILTVNIPDALYMRLKKSAESHRRNIHNELIVCLEKALIERQVNTSSVLASAKILRERIDGLIVTDEDLCIAKNAGRR